MTDVRLVPSDDMVDLAIVGGDLEADQTLRTAALISLFTHGLADPEDDIPDGTDLRRGWWAANLLPQEADDFFGSRLWVLSRAKLTNETLGNAENFAEEALEWLIRGGIAEEVAVEASRLDSSSIMVLEVSLVRGTATGRPALWEAFGDLTLQTGPLRVKVAGTLS